MNEYDRPAHPATKVMALIAVLMGIGVLLEGVNQAQSYFAAPSFAEDVSIASTSTTGIATR